METRHGRIEFWTRLLLALMVSTALPATIAAQVSVDGALSHEMELQPGGVHSGTITLLNSGSRLEEVKLYQMDYRSESPGRNYYEDPGVNPRSNAAWISTSPKRFSIPPGESYTISYVLEVPADDTLTGTYWSILMMEPIPPESPESQEADPEEMTVGIQTRIRYAFNFVTHIGTSGTVQPEIEGATLTLVAETPTLCIDIANAGTRMLKIEIWTELYDGDGSLVARRDGTPSRLYPFSSRQYQIGLADISVGEYTALVIIDAGDNNVFGASFPLVLE